jgi:threonine/homoserine/homoserine lactone efflux protein
MLIDSTQLFLFLTATVALNLAPGPDVLYVLANSARHGVRGGVFATLGISAGIVFHTCIAAFGVAAVLLAHRWAFDALRVVGALYLIWLGIGAWKTAETLELPGTTDTRLSRVFSRGLITNVLNPKVALFFMAFLPQFADPPRGNVTLQVLTFGALFIVSGTLVNLLYAWAGGALSATFVAMCGGNDA